MNDHERERIADAFNRLRPDWPTKQLRTLLADSRLVDRPRRDVVVALGWVACEPGTSSPYRVLEAGPWWRAVAVDDTETHVRDVAPLGSRCTVCGLTEEACAIRWAHDHEFARPRPRDVDLTPVVAELKDHVQPMRDRPKSREHTHTERGDQVRAALADARSDA